MGLWYDPSIPGILRPYCKYRQAAGGIEIQAYHKIVDSQPGTLGIHVKDSTVGGFEKTADVPHLFGMPRVTAAGTAIVWSKSYDGDSQRLIKAHARVFRRRRLAAVPLAVLGPCRSGALSQVCCFFRCQENRRAFQTSSALLSCTHMEKPPAERFDHEKSPLREVYLLLGAATPLELSNLYTEEDQKLMKSGSWDYDNPGLITNKVKDLLETADTELLTEEEKEWRQEILWFWHHHAISCAVWRHQDKAKAQEYAVKALEYQPEDHPNKITRLLALLIESKVQEAEEWAAGITEEPEKSTAMELLEDYKEKPFFNKS